MADDHSAEFEWKLLASATWRLIGVFLLLVLLLPEVLYRRARRLIGKLTTDIDDIELNAIRFKQKTEQAIRLKRDEK